MPLTAPEHPRDPSEQLQVKEAFVGLPLRQNLFFPGEEVVIDVGRKGSKLALKHARLKKSQVLLLTQKEASVDQPQEEDLYSYGSIAELLPNPSNFSSGVEKVRLRILKRAKVLSYEQLHPYILVFADEIDENKELDDARLRASLRQLDRSLWQLAEDSGRIGGSEAENLIALTDPVRKVDVTAARIIQELDRRYQILAEADLYQRVHRLIALLEEENDIALWEREIHDKLKEAIEESQREYYLREKLKVIHTELGEEGQKDRDIEKLREDLAEKNLPDAVRKALVKELDRLASTSIMSPDYGNLLHYMEFALSLPWNHMTVDRGDLGRAQEILDEDHAGLKEVKERILEFLAVGAHAGHQAGSILCLVGPPGVGKTSLAKSVARATERDYVRVSLGGVQDEAEIRGHRRTYIGAMPGRLLKGIAKAGSSNPVFLLDEIDKISKDFRGDPQAALLEALDPAQNENFSDHYLEIEYDLSKVLFITTANSLQTISQPLLDRMEVIQLTGYALEEKLDIAKGYLLPKQRDRHALSAKDFTISDAALKKLAQNYSREAGVRELERQIERLCRKAVTALKTGKGELPFRVTVRNLEDLLGPEKYRKERHDDEPLIGQANGLAWTKVGGDILKIECQVMKGKGRLEATGTLGEVMKESTRLSLSYLRSHAEKLGLEETEFGEIDIHVHVPDGATPKDGPSAGMTITLALYSALSGRSIRQDVAMTGEMTLGGRILPVGGIREKVLAAKRDNISTILLPKDNEAQVREIPKNYIEDCTFYYIDHIEELWPLALAEEA